MAAEEATLRAAAPGSWPGNVFETQVGHFWGILETRPYMRNRYALVEAILKINTFKAVETALSHIMDMLRLCRSDNMGVRSQAPALMLRLNKDQECYDFVKWWRTCDPAGNYDWGDTSLPYLNIKDADVFEPCDVFLGRYNDLGHTVALTLLKSRLLTNLQSLQNTATLASEELPQELIDLIRENVAGPLVLKRPDIIRSADHQAHIANMRAQVLKLYKRVKEDNAHFWPAIINPGRHLTARPDYHSSGSVEEMQITLAYSFASWVETPGAVDIIKTLESGLGST